jgi:hypothetical protein
MNEIDEDLALSILFANTKRKKRELDLLTIAKSTDFLVNLYGSQKVVAEKIGLSNEMIRKFLLPLAFPKDIQKIIQDRHIDSIDVINEISSIKEKDIQISLFKELKNIPAKDVRDIVRILKNSNLSVHEAKKTILNQRVKHIHFFMLDLNDDEYKVIIKKSKEQKIDPAIFVKNLLINGLKRNNKET